MKYHAIAHRVLLNAIVEIIVLLLDLSPSMDLEDWPPSRKGAALKANCEFIEIKADQHPEDCVGLIKFWKKAEVLCEPVPVRAGLPKLRRALRDPRGGSGTNFTQALELAEKCLFASQPEVGANPLWSRITSLLLKTDPNQSPRHFQTRHQTKTLKRIVLLSDGEHNTGPSPVDLASKLKESGVIIDCIGIGGSPSDVDEELLKRIASRSPNGSIRYCFIGDHQQLLKKYQSLANHIRPV